MAVEYRRAQHDWQRSAKTLRWAIVGWQRSDSQVAGTDRKRGLQRAHSGLTLLSLARKVQFMLRPELDEAGRIISGTRLLSTGPIPGSGPTHIPISSDYATANPYTSADSAGNSRSG